MLDAGLITEISADTLMMYAYTIPHLKSAQLALDTDESRGGVEPKAAYTLTMEPKFLKNYCAMKKATEQTGLWAKLKVIRLLKKGIPAPGTIEDRLSQLAKAYLPEKYKVEVILV